MRGTGIDAPVLQDIQDIFCCQHFSFEVALCKDVRMAERSKAPDSRFTVFPVTRSILVHNSGRGFESHFGHDDFVAFSSSFHLNNAESLN